MTGYRTARETWTQPAPRPRPRRIRGSFMAALETARAAGQSSPPPQVPPTDPPPPAR